MEARLDRPAFNSHEESTASFLLCKYLGGFMTEVVGAKELWSWKSQLTSVRFPF